MSLLSIASVVLAQLVLLTIPDSYLVFSFFIWPIMFIYHCFILKRIFKLSFGDLVLKSIVALGLFFVAYIGISIIGFLIMLVEAGGDLEAFRPK